MAFKRWNKAPSKKTPKRAWSESEMKIVGWCLNNNIKVGISPDWKGGLNNWIIEIKISVSPDWETSSNKWQIDININGNNHNDPSRYTDDIILEKKYEYYKYYYDKYNKQQSL